MKIKQTSTCRLAGNQMSQLPDKEYLMNFCLSRFVLFFWTNVDSVHWCIYAFAGLSRLTNKVFIQLSTSKIKFNTNISSYLNLFWLVAAIWQHTSRSPLAQVMACCLMAPNHYLSQCWVIIREVLWHSPEANFTGNTQDIYPLKITHSRIQAHLYDLLHSLQ